MTKEAASAIRAAWLEHQVLAFPDQKLTDEQLDTFKNQVYAKFIEDAKAEMTVKKYDVWAEIVPSTPSIPAEYRLSGEQ